MYWRKTKRTNFKQCIYCLQAALFGFCGVVLLFLLLPANAHMPTGSAAITDEGSWTTYTTAHGLPSNYVFGGIVLDKNGYVWAGFQNGYWDEPPPINSLISRWKDNTWQSYELPGCRVLALSAGRFAYAGTYCPGPSSGAGYGLNAFIEDSWVNYMPVDGLVGTYIQAITSEGDDKVWIAASDVLCCYGRLNLLDHKGTASKDDDEWVLVQFPDRSRDIRVIAIDPNGNRWFGTSDGVVKLTANDEWVIYDTDVIPWASDIVFDAYGGVWFYGGLYPYRVSRYYEDSWTYYTLPREAIEVNYDVILTSTDRDGLRHSGFTGLWAVEGNAGVWIINGLYNGVSFYDGQAWRYYTWENSGLGGNRVYGITVDDFGNVWFATQDSIVTGETGGVSRFTPNPDFSIYVQPSVFLSEPGETSVFDLTIAVKRGFVPSVTLSLAGLPPLTTGVFSANPSTPTSQVQLTISVTEDADFGVYPLLILATGADITQTAPLTMHIVPEVYRYYFPIAFTE